MTPNPAIVAIEAHLDVLLERYENDRRDALQAMTRRLHDITEGPHSALANAIRVATRDHMDDIDAEYRARRDALRADIDDIRDLDTDYVRNNAINVEVTAYAETLRRFTGDPVRWMVAQKRGTALPRRLRDERGLDK